MEPEGTLTRQWAMTLCRDAGFEPDVRFETTDLLLHQRLVEQHAAAFLPDLVFGGQPPTVALRRLPRGRRTGRIFTVVRQGRRRHPGPSLGRRRCTSAPRRAARRRARRWVKPRISARAAIGDRAAPDVKDT
ncbi:type 2 periplasmic-binding domain-containing protein [Streptomyces griseiscabiei]|uniref:LysR substrate-binding domain-containing protein n=2 Tax=Streptomyces griseiscabiei TaxID=2993540 RepID=A0ABU4L7X2_9ACTN|nr:hypothetical protein [Streptomyces griseiscabiei]MDX2911244.1 hypothetical protein [Streptomyces griseiscabiei]